MRTKIQDSKLVTFYMPKALIDKYKAEAARLNVSYSFILRQQLEKYFSEAPDDDLDAVDAHSDTLDAREIRVAQTEERMHKALTKLKDAIEFFESADEGSEFL